MIVILRLGHRLPRDERISTHVCLVGRAFGADGIIYTGQHDSGLEESIERIRRWGGKFWIEYAKSHMPVIRKYKENGFSVVHLTMYGLQMQKEMDSIRRNENLLVIVGGEAVPSDVYQIADFNIAVTNQPHSEVGALAVFMHEYFEGKELETELKDAKIRIEPSEKGKKVIGI
ncbi:MAG: tRNA (cytidine(56)-2'-O)-methyltransferase [Candidatus Micrarchaeota archaeon]